MRGGLRRQALWRRSLFFGLALLTSLAGGLLMLDVLRKQCKIPPERFVVDLEDKGNPVGSTIPIALADAYRAGTIKPKARVMLVGFGVGLSWLGPCRSCQRASDH